MTLRHLVFRYLVHSMNGSPIAFGSLWVLSNFFDSFNLKLRFVLKQIYICDHRYTAYMTLMPHGSLVSSALPNITGIEMVHHIIPSKYIRR